MPNDRIIEPLSEDLPLAAVPHLSRVTQHELSGDLSDGGSKNYKHIAFRPGYALQAAELNEMQQHFQLQMALTVNMYNNWMTSGIPSLWTSATEGTSAIGQGATGVDTVSAPGWKGTCPLFPFDSPYVEGGATNLVDVTVGTGSGTSIIFRPGWYLTELRAEAQGPNASFINGLKYWVYNNIETSFASLSVPDPVDLTVVGFRTSAEYVCPEEDSSLYDNAGGYSDGNPSTGGGCRYKVELQSVDYDEFFSETSQNISAVLKLDPADRSIRYMNNLLIANY